MNSILSNQYLPPHLLPNNRLSPSRSGLSPSHTMSSRKRKADDDGSSDNNEDRMSASPSGSPAVSSRPLPRHTKRLRTNLTGRPLPLPRLLETLGAEEMRNMLRQICERHPDIGTEIVATTPRPSVSSAMTVLGNYESSFQAAFPFGGRNSSDYSYNRVRQNLTELLDALKDFTPHFLPPNESQSAISLAYLDGATEIIHRLPDWDTYQHNRHKYDAYEELGKAWACIIREASKRGGGIQLQYGGWDQKIAKHNEASRGRMGEAVDEVRKSLGWMGSDNGAGNPGNPTGAAADPMSIRQQLLSGTYGMGAPVRVGPW